MKKKNPFDFLFTIYELLKKDRTIHAGVLITMALVLWRHLCIKLDEPGFDETRNRISTGIHDPSGLVMDSLYAFEEKHPKLTRGIFSAIPLRNIYPEISADAWQEIFACLDRQIHPDLFAGPEAPKQYSRVFLKMFLRDYGPDTWLSLYELYQFMAGIVDVQGRERVMFPGCESGIPVLACLDKEPGAMVHGQDVDPYRTVITKIHLALFGYDHSRITHAHLIQEPAFRAGQDRLAYFDCVISKPPMGQLPKRDESIRRDRFARFPDVLFDRLSWEMVFLAHCIKVMHPRTGRACVALPARFLNMESCRNIRSHLVSRNMIDTIVTLPRYIFAGFSADCILLTLNMNKKTRDVFFLEGEHFADPRKKTIDTHELLLACQDRRDKHPAMVISNVAIQEQDCNLFPLIYRRKESRPDQKSFHELSDELGIIEEHLGEVRKELLNRLSRTGR